MSNYFVINLGAASSAGLYLLAGNQGINDPAIYFYVLTSGNVITQPSEEIKVIIAPTGVLTSTQASGYLVNSTYTGDPANGIYVTKFKNEYDVSKQLTFPRIKIEDYDWENTQFELFDVHIYNDTFVFGRNASPTYSYPHNIQNKEVKIEGNLLDTSNMVEYRIRWDAITNSSSTDYGAVPSDGPYGLNVGYVNNPFTGNVSGQLPTGSSIIFSGFYYFDSSIETSGIYIRLPLYDSRVTTSKVWSYYAFRLLNNSPNASLIHYYNTVLINHQILKEKFEIDLDSKVKTTTDINRLTPVPDSSQLIKRGTIDRSRLSVGVKDIYVVENKYKKQGIYISEYYRVDYPIYTLSLKVEETIPDYGHANVLPYDIVKYYIEFNSNQWQQISPLSRDIERDDNNKVVPKILVFDKGTKDVAPSIKFMGIESVGIFRVKIAFDLSFMNDSNFVSPEIRNYKCILFDKNRFLNI